MMMIVLHICMCVLIIVMPGFIRANLSGVLAVLACINCNLISNENAAHKCDLIWLKRFCMSL